MEHTNVIIKPVITEKSTHHQTVRNTYAFHVRSDANKQQIGRAVEALYDVKVVAVRTLNRKGKPRRSRYRMSKTSDWKRAIVVLSEESRIELF